ncbi:hypothetical protein BH10ACT1_BH10ACT1_36680 [soil metagenome]
MCEGCGTVLPLPDAAGVIRCPSCSRVAWTEDPSDPYGPEGPAPTPAPNPFTAPSSGAAPPFATWTPGPATSAWATTATSGPKPRPDSSHPGNRVGCAITLVIVIAVIGAVTAAIIGVSSGSGPFAALQASKIYPSSGSTIVVPGEASSTDLITLATDNGDGSQRKLIRVVIDGSGGKETWKSAALPKDLYSAQLVIDGDDLWVGGQNHLLLLSLRTGVQKWEATLPDNLTTGCRSCFTVIGSTLVVRTDDAYVTGYSAASNESRWSHRLQNAAGGISIAGPALYVVDDPAKPQDLTQAVQLDPATGNVLKAFTPTCPAGESAPYPIEMGGGDPIAAVPGSTDVVSWFGSGYGCVTRIDTTTGKARWATSLPNGNYPDPDDGGAVIDDTHLLIRQPSAPPIQVDLATGKVRLLEAMPDAQAAPTAIVGTTILGTTTSTRGSAKAGLAAWDLNTGKRLWDRRLPGDSEPVSSGRYRSSDALFDGESRTLLVTGGKTVRLVTFSGDRTIEIQALDVATGDLGTAVDATLHSRYGTAGTPSLAVESVTPERLVLGVDSIVEVLDLRTGTASSWPPKN